MVTFVNLPKTQQPRKIGFQFGFGDMMSLSYCHTSWLGNTELFPVRYTFVNVAKLGFKTSPIYISLELCYLYMKHVIVALILIYRFILLFSLRWHSIIRTKPIW
jgi:hypothetical protein